MKKIRKMLPVSIYDLSGLETWLEEQAKSGLFPVFMNCWVTFTPTSLPGTRFRLEPREGDGDSPGPELLEKCREAGWDFALTVGSLYYLLYTTNLCASSTCFDDGARRKYMAGLEKRARRSRLTGWAVFIIMSALGAWGLSSMNSRFDVQPAPFARLPLLLLNLFDHAVLILLTVLLLFYIQNRRDRKAMKNSSGPETVPGPVPALNRVRMAEHVLTWVLAILVIIWGICRLLDINPFDHIALEKFRQPYVDIEELESVEVESWEELFREESPGGQTENYGRIRFSLLSPRWYSVTQESYDTDGAESRIFSPKPEEGQAGWRCSAMPERRSWKSIWSFLPQWWHKCRMFS